VNDRMARGQSRREQGQKARRARPETGQVVEPSHTASAIPSSDVPRISFVGTPNRFALPRSDSALDPKSLPRCHRRCGPA
jgi:hypothetical protein